MTRPVGYGRQTYRLWIPSMDQIQSAFGDLASLRAKWLRSAPSVAQPALCE